MEKRTLISVCDHPELFAEVAQWQSSKWKVPMQAYLDSMEEGRTAESGVPAWYVVKNEVGQIIAGIGVIENDFHDRKDLSPNVCAVYTEEEVRAIAKVCEEAEIFVLADEIYEKLCYNGVKPFSMAACSEKMKELRVADSIEAVMALARRCNKYIDETMPWALAKDEAKKDRLATVLYNLVEGISIGASLLESFMPETAQKVVAQLNTTLRSLDETKTFGLYPSGNKVVEKPEILFARLDVNEVLEKVAAKKAAEEAANHVPTV